MVIEKIVLKVGKKKIELTQSEYEELKQHFASTEWVPYPIYPQPQPWTYPIVTPYYTVTASTPNMCVGTGSVGTTDASYTVTQQ